MSMRVRVARGFAAVGGLSLIGAAFTWSTGNRHEAELVAAIALIWIALGVILTDDSRRPRDGAT